MKVTGWEKAVSTCFGLGFLTRMPGTVASFAAVLAAFAIPINIFVLAATIVIGVIASGSYAAKGSAEDPPEVVIDEVAGMWIALYGHAPGYFIPALGLFRIFDIVKPFPIRNAEKLPGGIGIMADDIIAGIFANLLLRGVTWFFFSGGFQKISDLW